ncbi:MAG: HAD-IIB family hydrolase [Balneolaceae bacterium]
MIKLFITDLDGCVSHPHISPDWDTISEIRALIEQSKTDSTIPPMTICSGRPLPYVEAVSQWLGMYHPMVFESGGGIYDMKNNKLMWNASFDDKTERDLEAIKVYLKKNFVEKVPGAISEFAKRTDAGLIHQSASVIDEMYAEIVPYIEANYPRFEVHYTDVSINIIAKTTNKGFGIRQLAELLEIELNEIAYIGDTGGDIPGLKIVGQSFAPKNAKDYVRAVCDYSLEEDATHAVLAAYKQIITHNREKLAAEEMV